MATTDELFEQAELLDIEYKNRRSQVLREVRQQAYTQGLSADETNAAIRNAIITNDELLKLDTAYADIYQQATESSKVDQAERAAEAAQIQSELRGTGQAAQKEFLDNVNYDDYGTGFGDGDIFENNTQNKGITTTQTETQTRTYTQAELDVALGTESEINKNGKSEAGYARLQFSEEKSFEQLQEYYARLDQAGVTGGVQTDAPQSDDFVPDRSYLQEDLHENNDEFYGVDGNPINLTKETSFFDSISEGISGISDTVSGAFDTVTDGVANAWDNRTVNDPLENYMVDEGFPPTPGLAEEPDDLENYFYDEDRGYIPLSEAGNNNPSGQAGTSDTAISGSKNEELVDNKPGEDWRLKLSISDHLPKFYNDPNDPGILFPLQETKGLVFPYTPTITVQHAADYQNYDLTHSNHRGYFYTGSRAENLVITAMFTAQDTREANYMLAAIHFLRSASKMFYGQDNMAGMPPPVLFLTGFGQYQFNRHPCVISMVNFTMPNDVDYIAAGKPDLAQPTSNFQFQQPKNSGHQSWSTRISRTLGAGLNPGAEKGKTTRTAQLDKNTSAQNTVEKYDPHNGEKTYVPTKIEIQVTLLPIQTRTQVSEKFSLQDYASGKLLKGGFW